jgi:hypothetical protein
VSGRTSPQKRARASSIKPLADFVDRTEQAVGTGPITDGRFSRSAAVAQSGPRS